jgi:hypothetical protein
VQALADGAQKICEVVGHCRGGGGARVRNTGDRPQRPAGRHGTPEVSSNIVGVSQEANDAGAAANQVYVTSQG